MEKPTLIVTGSSEALGRFLQKARSRGAGAIRSVKDKIPVVEVRGAYGKMLEDVASAARAEGLEIVSDKEGPKDEGRVALRRAAA